jgi:hypothetical protein
MDKRAFWAVLAAASVAALVATVVARRRMEACAQAAHDDELVSQASDDSFPASDPPSYTPTSSSQTG